MTIESALLEGAKSLQDRVERPRLEAEILMAYHLNCERVWLHLHGCDELVDGDRFFDLIARRAESEPIEYITQRTSFYDMELVVGRGVLIPRPETEILVDRAAEAIEALGIRWLCEIGVGSGAVSIALARKFPDLHIVATDISPQALTYAQHNIWRYGLQERIRLKQTHLMDCVTEEVAMIVSNPPYIQKGFALPPSVRYEPESALIGGERGDEMIKEILMVAKQRGINCVACEMGYDQQEPLTRFFRQLGWRAPHFYKDLAGLDRGFVWINQSKENNAK